MKFRKKITQKPEISTASMPDIVFLLLFFFMVTATIDRSQDQLKVQVPQARAITKIQKKFLIKELHVGFPKDPVLGSSPRISTEDRIISITDLGNWVQEQKTELGEAYKDQMIVMLKADVDVDMGLIGDIQVELRKHNARKVLFRTLEVAY
ncbi:MAG: biopolymer transporter ExbD [Cyclobacteriaceae bacterium]